MSEHHKIKSSSSNHGNEDNQGPVIVRSSSTPRTACPRCLSLGRIGSHTAWMSQHHQIKSSLSNDSKKENQDDYIQTRQRVSDLLLSDSPIQTEGVDGPSFRVTSTPTGNLFYHTVLFCKFGWDGSLFVRSEFNCCTFYVPPLW
ncbi:uncharacterized protein [Asterias amurensis]|uniref:uncharacterized protein n=1 Tax=Asterias amurensis TaxID=7602 RepID=UPI003AB46E88